MEEIVKELLAETVGDREAAKNWTADTDIINDIGIDSLQVVHFMLAVEDRLGMSLDYEALSFEDFSSIRALTAFLEKQAG